jgi:hypothetical protein
MLRCMAAARALATYISWRGAHSTQAFVFVVVRVANPLMAAVAAMEVLLRLVLRAFERQLVLLMPFGALPLETLDSTLPPRSMLYPMPRASRLPTMPAPCAIPRRPRPLR